MGAFITSLNSGSNGNCYYVGNGNEAILVDVGISCKEVETRMAALGLATNRVKAIFISHEHTDHIRGVELFSKKHQVPVYVTDLTRRRGRIKLERNLSRTFSNEPVTVGAITIKPFQKFHDAADPYSFLVSCEGINIGVFTDLGKPCANLVHHFRQCHAAFLESNYDEAMLANGRYPNHLKKRITGGLGHLSNTEALALFREHRPEWLSHLFLSHISQNNNCPKLVKQMFDAHAEGVEMVIASRHAASEVYHITGKAAASPKTFITRPVQLQLSFS